jgi:dienelactone hydrolase
MEAPVRCAIAAATLALLVMGPASGFATGVALAPGDDPAPDDPAELDRTWRAAQVIVDDGGEFIRGILSSPATSERLARLSTPLPAILYLHGCDGLDRRANLPFWRAVAEAGYAVFMPDSFARLHRAESCGKQASWTYAARLGEIDYALERIAELGWVDMSKLVLYGHSEGGIAASRYPGDAFRGVVITSSSCNKYRVRARALAVYFASDRGLNERPCLQADERLVLRGRGHEVLGHLEARRHIRGFIDAAAGRRLEAGGPAIAAPSPFALTQRHD